ncbi:SIR2 family protein [Phosphitispora sp. TUW77]|uniref:SIR2 family protein n=1 Tax=Phosphitispora sp. TUW77 TaxID=3152361 RepID=UPI003AB4F994
MKKVFVLGSGFSSDAGAPLTSTVLKNIFKQGRGTRHVSELESYISNFLYQGRSDWINCSSLEEILSRLDIIKHYKPYPYVDYNEVIHYEELLLKEFTNLLKPDKTNCLGKSYQTFASFLKDENSIITFNYDLLIENLLMDNGKFFCYPDFSFIDYKNSDNTRTASEEFNQFNNDSSCVRVIKLHGSLNMYYCPCCGQIYRFPESVTIHPLPGESEYRNDAPLFLTCLLCSRRDKNIQLRHFIIAPTLYKSYSLPALRRLWFSALETLANAVEIFFIGYSLPHADILSYQLFDFAAKLSAIEQAIFLVNGQTKSTKRFKQLYGDSVRDTGMTFAQWTESIN